MSLRALVWTVLTAAAGPAAVSVTGQEHGDDNPGKRYGHELVYDEARAVTILFGGFGEDGAPMGDTWSFNGEAWELVAEAGRGPSPRRWPAMVYDAKRERLVLNGGREGVGRFGASLSDTWAWDGRAWRRVATDGPSGRDHHRMAYDRERDQIVLFGGWDGGKVVGDTWEWDGTRWSERSSQGDAPEPRAPLGLVYDEARREIVLFGGQDLERSFGDTWRLRSDGWEELEPEKPLPPRAFHGATYDPLRGHILVFSGRDGETLLTDTLSWDGHEWSTLDSDGPLRRGVYALAYDRRREVAVFHGSGRNDEGRWSLSDETWLWNGHRWTLWQPRRRE